MFEDAGPGRGEWRDDATPPPHLEEPIRVTVERDTGSGPADLCDADLVDEIVELERSKAVLEARIMLSVALLSDRADGWADPRAPGLAGRLGGRVTGPMAAAGELAPALHLSPITAAIRIDRACRVRDRLPRTLAALGRGELDLGRVLAIEEATRPLQVDAALRVEEMVLPAAVDQTAGELRAALRRAVIVVDPDGAEDRRKVAVRDRRVRRYERDDGTAALEAVLSAIDSGEIYDLVDEVARRTKTTDDTRSMDARRADALVWLQLGRDPHLGPHDDTPPPPPSGDGPTDNPRGPTESGPGSADVRETPDERVYPHDGEPVDAYGGSDGDWGDAAETSQASETDPTYADDARRPGTPPGADLRGHEVPAADEPHAESRHEEPEPLRERAARDVEPEWAGWSQWPDAAETEQRAAALNRFDVGREERASRLSELAALALSAMTCRRPQRQRWVTLNTVHGPHGAVTVGELDGYGPITREAAQHLLATGAARPPDPPSGRQPTPDQAGQHDPPAWLDRDIRARDTTCRFPGCRQPAHRADIDHTVAFPAGPTVPANLGVLCRRHHRLKHAGTWRLIQHQTDSTYTWKSTVTGRTYDTHPRGTTGNWQGATTWPW